MKIASELSPFKIQIYTNDNERFASVEHIDSATGMDIYENGTEIDWQDNNGLAANNPDEIIIAARQAAEESISNKSF